MSGWQEQILGPAAGVIGGLAGLTALLRYERMRKQDQQAKQQIAERVARDEGARDEREQQMRTQIDSAHNRIRALDERQGQQEKQMAEMARDVKHTSKTVDDIAAKIDRWIEGQHR